MTWQLLMSSVSASAVTTAVDVNRSMALDQSRARLGGNAYGPAAVYDATTTTTLISYLSSTGSEAARVVTYDHTAKTWGGPYNIGITYSWNDDHVTPCLVMLSDGRAVAFYGSHVNTLAQRWAISDAADFTTWTEQTNLGLGYTYPRPVNVDSGGGAGTLYLFSRQYTGSYQDYHVQSASYTSGGALSFGATTSLIQFSGERIYTAEAVLVGTDILLCWCRADTADTYRKDVYFAWYDTTTGSLFNLNKSVEVTSGSLPISRATADTDFLTHSPANNDTIIPSVLIDGTDTHLLFGSGTGATGAFDLMHDVWNGSSWAGATKIADLYNYDGASGFKGSAATLVSGPAGVEAYYTQTFTFSARGAEKITRRIWNGSTWGTATDVINYGGTYALYGTAAVRNGVDELRFIASETLQSSVGTDPVNLPLYVYGQGVAAFPAYTDSLFADVVEQVQYNLTPTATSVLDESPSAIIWDASGNAVTSSANGAEFDGVNDYFAGLLGGSASEISKYSRRYNFNTDPFTLEFFDVYMTGISDVNPLLWSNQGFSGNRGFSLMMRTSDNLLRLEHTPNGSTINSTDFTKTWSTGVSYYVCLCRDGSGTLRAFVGEDGADATLIGSATVTDSMTGSSSAAAMAHGARTVSASTGLQGYIKATRITKAARYTSDVSFTPPSLPLYNPAA